MTNEERAAWCYAEQEKALETVRRIDTDGWRFMAAKGDDELQDVTADRRAEQQRLADQMLALAMAWERTRS